MPSQREIVFLNFNLPQGTINHPGIVLSCSNAIEAENQRFVAVMMTSDNLDDEFSFPLTSDMIDPPMDKEHQEARLHIIGYFSKTDIVRNQGSKIRYLKKEYFENLIRRIYRVCFDIKL